MGWKRDDPGCPCCDPCACVANLPSTFYADGHAMVWTPAFNVFTVTWLMTSTPTYTFAGVSSECVSDGTIDLPVQYGLTPCATVLGEKKWRMTIGFPATLCRPVGTYFEYRYANPANPKTTSQTLTSLIPWSCDFTMLTFTFPTVLTTGSGTDLPVPGGGGTIVVVP